MSGGGRRRPVNAERFVAVMPVALDAVAVVHGWSRTTRQLARRVVLDAWWVPDETGAQPAADFSSAAGWAEHLGARRRTVADALTALAAAGFEYVPAVGHRPGRLAVPGELYRQLVQALGDERGEWAVWLRPAALDDVAADWDFARRARLEDLLCVADETGQLGGIRTKLAANFGPCDQRILNEAFRHSRWL